MIIHSFQTQKLTTYRKPQKRISILQTIFSDYSAFHLGINNKKSKKTSTLVIEKLVEMSRFLKQPCLPKLVQNGIKNPISSIIIKEFELVA